LAGLIVAGNVARRPDGAWRARYRDPSGREHSQHFDRKLDAERWQASVQIAQARGEWLDPHRARVRVGEWATTWLAGQVQLKPSTRARYELARPPRTNSPPGPGEPPCRNRDRGRDLR